MFYWWFHFEKEFPINCLFTQWKWTYILDYGSWKWSVLNMGYMDKWLSRMQGQFYFSKSGIVGNNFQSGSKILLFFLWGLPEGSKSRALAPIHLPLKAHGGRFSVRRVCLCYTMVFKLTEVYTMTLGNSMHKNILPLHT